MTQQKQPAELLEIVAVALDLLLAVLLGGIVVQNRVNLQPGAPWESLLVTLGLILLVACFVVGGVATVAQARRLSAGAHRGAALGFLLLGGYVVLSLWQGRGTYGGVPWQGLMVSVALLGLGGLYFWLASQTKKRL